MVSFFKELVRLATHAHDYIDTNKGIGHKLLNASYLAGKERCVVMAVHEFKHCVAAALQWNMEVGHEGTRVGAKFNNLVGE